MAVKPKGAGRWVRFTAPFDFTPAADRRATVAYPEGHVGRVTAECAEAAIADGKAEETTDPNGVRDEDA